jgi:hypothetical protein
MLPSQLISFGKIDALPHWKDSRELLLLSAASSFFYSFLYHSSSSALKNQADHSSSTQDKIAQKPSRLKEPPLNLTPLLNGIETLTMTELK